MSPNGPRVALHALVLALAALAPCACAPSTDTSSPLPSGSAASQGADSLQAPSLETGLQLYRQGDLKGAEPHLAGALKQSPRDRRLLEALGSIYARTDRWKQAEESFRAALGIEPESIGARLGLAALFIDTGRYQEAQAMLGEVRRRDPANLFALLKAALLDARLGRTAEAEAGAREVVARQPSNAEAHYVLGLALERRGALEEAAGEMRRVREITPAHPGALSHLVTLETRLGHAAEAARWRKAQQVALSRLHVEERVRGHRIRAVEAFNRKDYRTALDEFRAIAREDPDDPQVHLHLGSTFIALGNPDEAQRALDRCLALDPRNERALAEMGRLHALANRLDEAIEALKKAVALNPEFAEPHYYLAGIYMARGEPDRYQEEMKIWNDLSSRTRGSALEVMPEDGP